MSRVCPLVLRCSGVDRRLCRGGRRELAAVARPRRPGHLERDGRCRPSGARARTSRGRPQLPTGLFVADRLGRPDLPDRRDRRGRRPRREGRRMSVDGQARSTPTASAADKKHTLKVLALDTKTGKIVWEQTAYEGPVFDARHRRSTFAGPTAITDGKMVFAYFGPEGLYAYDFTGKLAWKVVGEIPHARSRHRHLAGALREPGHHSARRGRRRASVLVAYDKPTSGKEVWKTKRPVQISWANAGRSLTANGRTELVTNGTEFIIAYDPATGKELWRTKGVESNAIHTPLVGNGLVIVTAGFPAKKIIAIRPGAVPDDKRVAWEYTKGTGYVLSNILYGDYVYLSPTTASSRCLDAENWSCEVRRRPPTGADALHGFAGGVCRSDRDDERRRRHLHAQGRTEARDRPHQLGRRASVLVARDCKWTNLHPRREASVRDREVTRFRRSLSPLIEPVAARLPTESARTSAIREIRPADRSSRG